MHLIADHISRFGALGVLDDVSFQVASGEGGGDRRSLGLWQEHAAIDPRRPAAAGRRRRPTARRAAVTVSSPLTFVFQGFRRCCRGARWKRTWDFTRTHWPEPWRPRADVDDALRRTETSDFRGAYPKPLSGGMRQRVASPARWRCGPRSC